MFASKSLKVKLISAFMAVTLFMVFVAGAGYISMKKVFTEFDYIAKIVVNNLKTTGKMGDQLRDMHQNLIRVQAYHQLEEKKKFSGLWLDNSKDLEATNTEYESIKFEADEAEIWNAYKKAWGQYQVSAKKFIELGVTEDPEQLAKSVEFFGTQLRTDYLHLRDSISKVWAFHEDMSHHKGTLADEAYKSSLFWSVGISLAGIIFALSVGIYFANLISRTMTSFSNEISTSASQTSTASRELTSASSQLSQGATESAASLEETVSSLEELSSMVKLNSDHAKEANSLSQRSLSSAEIGQKEIAKLISAMSVMEKSSQKIEEIINVIDDIAFQTNLLALNAAVEAARAGEQGKGFAVVADAVRNLAQRSASAAKDINSLIKENVESTHQGVKIADSSGHSLNEIVTSVKKVADLNSEIAAASQEQANGIEQISKAMNHLDQAIQTNASSSEEVASSAEEMSSQADCLATLVTDLKTFINGKGHSGVTFEAAPVAQKKQAARPQFKVVNSPKSSHSSPDDILPLDDHKHENIGKAEGF